MSLVEITEGPVTCDLCHLTAKPEGVPRLGQMYQLEQTTAHHFCLILASGLAQNGQDGEGILGFFPWDIEKEVRRGAKLRCYLCKKSNATVGCCVKTCKKSFHLPCCLTNGGLSQFFGSYNTYCCEHRPKQRVPEVYWKWSGPSSKNKPRRGGGDRKRVGHCGVCLDKMSLVPGGNTSLWTPCCKGWFHRKCVEAMADASGCHFFKCPLCNNKEVFEKEMLRYGIYLPDRDALWETEEDAYQELYTRHDSCDAVKCLCPGGRQGGEEDTDFELVLCELCGSRGVHAMCANLDPINLRWKCSTCLGALKPKDKEDIEDKLDKTDGVVKFWTMDNDSTDENVEDEEEELEVFSDSEVFEKCFKSNDDQIWRALTSVFKIDVAKIDIDNTPIANKHQVLDAKTEVDHVKTEVGGSDEGESDQEFEVFNCEECSFDCRTYEGLVRHMNLHDPSREFVCQDCGLRFEKERHVVIHARKHTGEKPWVCALCQSDFSESWSLKLHMSKHDLKRKHPCQHCSLRFKSNRAVNVHVEKHHSKVKKEEIEEKVSLFNDDNSNVSDDLLSNDNRSSLSKSDDSQFTKQRNNHESILSLLSETEESSGPMDFPPASSSTCHSFSGGRGSAGADRKRLLNPSVRKSQAKDMPRIKNYRVSDESDEDLEQIMRNQSLDRNDNNEDIKSSKSDKSWNECRSDTASDNDSEYNKPTKKNRSLGRNEKNEDRLPLKSDEKSWTTYKCDTDSDNYVDIAKNQSLGNDHNDSCDDQIPSKRDVSWNNCKSDTDSDNYVNIARRRPVSKRKRRRKENVRKRNVDQSSDGSDEDISSSSIPVKKLERRSYRSLENISDSDINDGQASEKMKKQININSVKGSNIESEEEVSTASKEDRSIVKEINKIHHVKLQLKNPVAMILDIEKDKYKRKIPVKDEEIIDLLSSDDDCDELLTNNSSVGNIKDIFECMDSNKIVLQIESEDDDIKDLLTDSDSESSPMTIIHDPAVNDQKPESDSLETKLDTHTIEKGKHQSVININEYGEEMTDLEHFSLGIMESDEESCDLSTSKIESSTSKVDSSSSKVDISSSKFHSSSSYVDLSTSKVDSSTQKVDEPDDVDINLDTSDKLGTAFTCHLCPISYTIRWHLSRHIKQKHVGSKSEKSGDIKR